MQSEVNGFNKIFKGWVMILSSIIVSGFWILVNTIDVYEYAIVGVFFELLSIFMILLLFAGPVLALIAAINNRFKNSFLYIASILLNTGTLLWMIYK